MSTLLDAAARVVMAYTLPPDMVPALGTLLYAATTVVLLVVVNVLYIASGVHDPDSLLYQSEPSPRVPVRGLSTSRTSGSNA